MEEGQRPDYKVYVKVKVKSLNPCCNGRGSKTVQLTFDKAIPGFVLILVVMEEGQRRIDSRPVVHRHREVLILVVMEEGQRQDIVNVSLTFNKVLILVVMEEGQRRQCCKCSIF